MEIDQKLNPPVQCRLCGNYGDHRFEIFDSSAGDISSSLSEKILRCLDIEVISSDPTTVICAECFNKLFGYDQFREVCHATNRKIKNSLSRHHSGVGNGVTFKSIVKHEAQAEPVITYLVSDSDANGETKEMAISGNLTPKIERLEDDLVAQIIIDLSDSSSDEISVFASTSSTIVKHECPESATFLPKLEMTENEQTVEFPLDDNGSESATDADSAEDDLSTIRDDRINDSPSAAHGSDSKIGTDMSADEVDHVARAPRKKILRRMRSSIPAITVKKEHDMKTKKNASKLPIKCSFPGSCKDSFENHEAMKLHEKFYHGNRDERTFCCHMCNATVTERRNLTQHMNNLHTRAIRFMCPNRDCSKIFTQKIHLNAHINAMHKNQVAFECPKCSEAFTRELFLKKHLATAHGDGIAFVCDLCRKAFITKRSLDAHIKSIHMKVTLYECTEATCSKSFNRKSNMKSHFNAVHSQKKMYKCTKCPAEFKWSSSLRVHLLQKH